MTNQSENTGVGSDREGAVHRQTSPRFKWKSGTIIGCAGISGIAGINALMPDQTMQIIGMYYGVAVWTVLTLFWWLFFSGTTWGLRLGLPAAVVTAAISSWLGFVSRLDFGGDMSPKFVWRWQASANVKRDAWLKNQVDTTTPDPALSSPFAVAANDWPRYRGADGLGIVREPLTIRDWKQHPPQQLWRHPIGEGWSSFAVAGSRLFTQEQRRKYECIVCYHADSGNELWVHRDEVRYETAMGGIGPRATPTVTDSAVYAVGAKGLLTCLDPVTGEQKWQRNIAGDADASLPQWGFSGSPMIWKDTVIVIAGGSENRGVLAYDRYNGNIVWGSGIHRAGYSSPRVETINGKSVLLAFHGDGLTAMSPDSGVPQWNYPFTNMYHINVAQPILVGTVLFVGTGYDGRCVALDPSNVSNGRPTEIWTPNRNLNLKFNEAVAHGGYVYGLDDGILCCINITTGKREWKGGRYNFGQMLLWKDVLLIQAEKGYVALAEASARKFTEITRFSALKTRDTASAKVWNVPVVNKSRLYIRSSREAACFQLPQLPANN